MTALPNLDDLARLAREAGNHGSVPWYTVACLEDADRDDVLGLLSGDAAFIAAASPAVVMGLVERVLRYEKALRDVREMASNDDLNSPLCLRDRITMGDGREAHEDLDEIMDVIHAALHPEAKNPQPSEATNE